MPTDRRAATALNRGAGGACAAPDPEIAATRGSPDCDEFRTDTRCRFKRRNSSLLREHGETMPDARAEVQREPETFDLRFPRSKIRCGGSIRLSDFD